MFRLLGLSDKSDVLKYLGIGIGGVVLMLQAAIANRRAKAMQLTAEAHTRSNENAEHGLRQERLKNAIEHLGNKSESVRLGGAHELFHLAQDTRDDDSIRQTILDILCAHIRRTTGNNTYLDRYSSKPSEEIQSLLILLFVQEHDVFTGLRINLRESWLNGADLRRARLMGADLREARLNEADLESGVLQEAGLEEAYLKGANFRRATLREARLFAAHMHGTMFLEAEMQGVNIQYGNLTTAAFTYANLRGAHLAGAKMYGTILTGAHMEGADISGAYLQASRLKAANLRGAGSHDWDSSIPFADRISGAIGKACDLSNLGEEGMYSRNRVDEIASELLRPEDQMRLKKEFEPYVDCPAPPRISADHGAILGSYTQVEAEQWITEHGRATLVNRRGLSSDSRRHRDRGSDST